MDKTFSKGKTAAKTALMTLLALILTVIIAASLACFISPRTMGNLFNGMGWRSFSTYLTKSAYDRSGDINDLGDLVERAVSAKNDRVVNEYAEKLLGHEDYAEFVRFKNDQAEENLGLAVSPDYDSYVKGNYVSAKYRTGGKEEAFQLAKLYVSRGGGAYPAANAMTKFVEEFCGDEDSPVTVQAAADFLSLLYAGMPKTDAYKSDLRNVCMDGYLVAKKAQDEAGMQIWNERYLLHK